MDFLGLGEFFVCGEVANLFDEVAIREHFQKLCAKVGVKCLKHFLRAQEATQRRDWVVAYSEWTSCRDAIERSKGPSNRDDWLLFWGFHKLVCANLCAFYSMNFGQALRDAQGEVQNVPDALDFRSYVEPTLWMVMYRWALTSDCEEEALDPDVKAFLIDERGHPRDGMSDFVVRIAKSKFKKFLISKSEAVFHCIKTEKNCRWLREGKKRYPDKLDYVSKLDEAATLFMSGACEEVTEVLAEIRKDLGSAPLKVKGIARHPAARYCILESEFMIRQMLSICYQMMIDKERDECESLRAQMQSGEDLLPLMSRCLEEAGKHAENNRLDEAKACVKKFSDEFLWGRFLVPAFLDKLHTDLKIKYRQSYERGLPDESLFSSAKSFAEILRESENHFTLSQWKPRNFVRLVRLYHEKDREVMFSKQSPKMVDEKTTVPIIVNGRKAIECYVRALQHTKQDDYWIAVQELYKDVYYMLQFHNFALWIQSHECTLGATINIGFPDRLQQLWNLSLMSKGASADSPRSQEILKQSLMWAERRVGKAIYFQLAPNMLSTSAKNQIKKFDRSDVEAWKTLMSSRAACGPRTFILEYSVSKTSDLQFVYVMTKDNEVFMQVLKINGLDTVLSKLLKWTRNTFSDLHACKGAPINACLEWFYEVLISPVVHFLDDMKQEDKLIIVAPEILSDVPFAALRKPNSPVGEGYLIQSHTISITPSLRLLQHCNQRLKELDEKRVLDAKPGTIVLVGDPANNLPGCVEEVNSIQKMFAEEHVKKLVGSEATPAKVLEWAKYPSEKGVKQVVFHISAHGIGQDDGAKVKKGAIVLAQPPSSQLNDGQGARHKIEQRDSMMEVATQISSHGEVGGILTKNVVEISEDAPHLLKSENISRCGFQWEAHMVVLSACDTARGQITGEEVLNLPRALMIAGVPSVVVSQWKVDDQSTCNLMIDFYEELKSGKDVSSSLRAAMLKMIKNEGKVHQWAPFFVCGLPTVCLPTKFLRENLKPISTLKLIPRFFELANRGSFTCWECVAKLGLELELINDRRANDLRKLQDVEDNMEDDMRDLQDLEDDRKGKRIRKN